MHTPSDRPNKPTAIRNRGNESQDQQTHQQRIQLTTGGLHAGGEAQHQLASHTEQQCNRDSAADDERHAPQAADRDAIGTMAEPDAGEPHQLLTTHSNTHQHRRDLDLLNQQTIQKSQDQDAENSQAELKQPQTQTKSQRAQGRISNI